MPDTARRAALLARIRAARAEIAAIEPTLKNDGPKNLLRRSVTFHLDDVERLFLDDPSKRPSNPAHETQWLNAAEGFLQMAEAGLRTFKLHYDAFGPDMETMPP